jgi:hypothetical protein
VDSPGERSSRLTRGARQGVLPSVAADPRDTGIIAKIRPEAREILKKSRGVDFAAAHRLPDSADAPSIRASGRLTHRDSGVSSPRRPSISARDSISQRNPLGTDAGRAAGIITPDAALRLADRV